MTPEPAILEPPIYEPVLDAQGKRIGWKPAQEDRARFENGSGLPTAPYNPAADGDETPKPRALETLLDDLYSLAIGEPRLYDQLAALYAREPMIADRIAAASVAGAQSGALHDPTAFLASRLRPRK